MSKLKAISPKDVVASRPKILIFGQGGVGKTWFSLDFPNVYYIDTEGGASGKHYMDKLNQAGGIYFGVKQGSLSFETVLEQIQALATETHPYKTLVIDSITKIFNLEVAKEAERLGDKNAFGADKKPAIAYMRKLISWLTRLDMNVILIAHEKPLWGMANGERAEIGTTYDGWDKLSYELDLVFNIKKGGAARVGKVVKSRLEQFPDGSSLPWEFAEFAKRYGENIINADSKKIELATEAQIIKLNKLLANIKIDDATRDKWFKKANVESFEEMDTETVELIINHIEGKLQ